MSKKHRISSFYNLSKTQPVLDFVDVDMSTDTEVFLSPKALETLGSVWGDSCLHNVQHFFTKVLKLVKDGNNNAALELLEVLREPNETHLGLSSGRSRGRALGEGSAFLVWDALSNSAAAKTGLLQDLEDTILLVPGIGVDIVSDITTNLIRPQLIEYTQRMCLKEGIPLIEQIDSGPLWNPRTSKWESKLVALPRNKFGKLLLVPKAIVRRHPHYDLQEYFRHHLLTHIQQKELIAGSSLVTILKSGARKVHKSDIIEKIGKTKPDIIRETISDPTPFQKYKAKKENVPFLPLDHEDLADVEGSENPDWDALLDEVLSVKSGSAEADLYEQKIEALLSALFYSDLTNPSEQHRLHDGRQRVDIKYTNMAVGGFFSWIARHYPSQNLFVECKNYSSDIANNELAQILLRFSPSRGQIGLIISRKFDNKKLFQQRCKDTANDARGYVISLDDDDLKELVEARKSNKNWRNWDLLKARFDYLIE